MPVDFDPALFRETLGHYPTGVAVVTAVADDGSPLGLVVGTFSSVSLDPPLVAFFPMRSSRTFAQLRAAKAFCINVLASDQEGLCRQLATGGEHKYDGVSWRPSRLGAPVLEGAVSWVECTFEDVSDAGDHFIVLGRVRDFAVERSTLPLLFFQGGYGRFSPGSFVATPDPELIQAAQVAESIRSRVERISDEFEVNCSVVARVRWDAVQVLASNRSPIEEPYPLGHRQPLIPPFGAVFLADAPSSDIDEWLSRAPDDTPERREANLAQLAKVRERGYSLLVAEPAALHRHHEVLSAFELSDRLPRHERAVRQATSELANSFSPHLVPGERYTLANLVVRVETAPDQPPMALRITGLPEASTEQIKTWIESLTSVASAVR